MRTKFLVIEGCNGVGKSTITEFLSARTGATTFHYPPEFVRFRQEVRMDDALAPLPRLAYYLAATLHLSDLVRNQLEKTDVICDRYLASPLSLMIAESAIEEAKAWQFIQPFVSYLQVPDLTLLLTAEHAAATSRINIRHRESGKLTAVAQKTLESEDLFRKRQIISRQIARRLGPLVELETTNLSLEEMCASAWSLVAQRLNWTCCRA